MKVKIIDSKIERNKVVNDGWENILTSINIKGIDKKMSHAVKYDFMDEATASALYQTSDTAQAVIDILPDEMTRQGFKVNFENDESKVLQEKTKAWVEDYEVECLFNEAFKCARIYGGSAIYMGIDDGQNDSSKPVNEKTIKRIKYLVVLDRYDLVAQEPVNGDLESDNFGKPDFYMLSTSKGNKAVSVLIHYSRLIIFHGKQLPSRISEMNDYWGDSIFSKTYNSIRNYDTAFDSTATIMEDFTVPIMQIENLDDLLCSGQDDLIMKRLQLMKRTSSIVNAIVMKTGENYERKTTNVSGIKDILDKFEMRLVAAARIPHTILLGNSPSGLGATGESERNVWYDYVKSQQSKDYLPKLNQLFAYLFKTQEFSGVKDQNWFVEFNPLWQMSEKQTVELRKMQAETDSIYIQNNVLEPKEVTDSRFGGAEYSIETAIDTEMRKAIDEIELEEGEAEEMIQSEKTPEIPVEIEE